MCTIFKYMVHLKFHSWPIQTFNLTDSGLYDGKCMVFFRKLDCFDMFAVAKSQLYIQTSYMTEMSIIKA